jgi:hypothetical protein
MQGLISLWRRLLTLVRRRRLERDLDDNSRSIHPPPQLHALADHPTDAPTFAASAGLIVLVGLAASLVPAIRALSVDPTSALRSE